jgi:integrase
VVHGRISDVKTDLLPLDSAFAEVMLEWQKRCPSSEGNWVFPNPNTGNPYHASPIGQDYIRAAGRKVKLGKISVGTHVPPCLSVVLGEAGAPVGVQQKLMRHAQAATTMKTYGNAKMKVKAKCQRDPK